MAQLLYEKHSAKVHMDITRRNMRLCKQVKGCEQYATRIEPFHTELAEKKKATELAKYDKESAYDDVILYDTDLDNSVRTLLEKSKQYDRENPGRPVLIQLFPDGKASSIIYASLESEPDLAMQLLARLDVLGASHVLSSQSQTIKANIDKCKAALSAYHNSITLLKAAEAAQEISKSNLRRQYEFNYLDMVKEFGKGNADRLFPAINTSRKPNTVEDGNAENKATSIEKV